MFVTGLSSGDDRLTFLYQGEQVLEHGLLSSTVVGYDRCHETSTVSRHSCTLQLKERAYGARSLGVSRRTSPAVNTSWGYWAAASRNSELLANAIHEHILSSMYWVPDKALILQTFHCSLESPDVLQQQIWESLDRLARKKTSASSSHLIAFTVLGD